MASPFVHLVRQFVGFLVFRFGLGVFGVQRVDRCLRLGCQVGGRSPNSRSLRAFF
jgi:hypothetical protein